jgi:endonuclease/exonuclease/phosphatase family metal-dependent hydrolase
MGASLLLALSMIPCVPRCGPFVLTSVVLAVSACAQTGQPVAPASRQAPAQAPSAGIATFNLGWAGTPAEFDRYLSVCSAPKVNYCDTRARIERGAKAPTDAEKERAAQCQQDTLAAAGGREASMRVPPCNAYRPPRAAPGAPRVDPAVSRAPAAYREKIEQLAITVDRLVANEGARIIAFQEVSGTQVVKRVLGTHADRFDVCAARHDAFQTVAFAWDKAVTSRPGVCETEASLAILEPANDPAAFRRVRPGLALSLVINGEPVTFLNVHLKAGCASVTHEDTRYPGRLLDDPAEACDVLNRQVAPLEAWIESVAGKSPRFVWLGDVNRRIDDEEKLAIAADKVRSDGSDPASAHRIVNGKVSTRYLWPELNDGSPVLHQVPLSTKEGGCTGFTGLDHIVVSDALKKVNPGVVPSKKVAVAEKPGQRIETSDHCPRVARLRF